MTSVIFGPHNTPFFRVSQVHQIVMLYLRRVDITSIFTYLLTMFALSGVYDVKSDVIFLNFGHFDQKENYKIT